MDSKNECWIFLSAPKPFKASDRRWSAYALTDSREPRSTTATKTGPRSKENRAGIRKLDAPMIKLPSTNPCHCGAPNLSDQDVAKAMGLSKSPKAIKASTAYARQPSPIDFIIECWNCPLSGSLCVHAKVYGKFREDQIIGLISRESLRTGRPSLAVIDGRLSIEKKWPGSGTPGPPDFNHFIPHHWQARHSS